MVSHWKYKGTILETPPEGSFGFVYEVISKIDNKRYIGRKYFGKTRRIKPLKGRVNKRVIRSESDWKTYTGSCKELNDDIQKYGKENFEFIILIICETKGQTNFSEEALQHKRNVLIDSTYYNANIGNRKTMSIKMTDKFKKELMEL